MSLQSSLFRAAAIAAFATLLPACDGSVRREGPPQAWLQVARDDPRHNRVWVLDPEALTLYDKLNRRRLRRIELPLPFFVGGEHACPPDIAFDASGTVFVSSNIVPVLWRVDPRNFDVTRIELELGADGDKDVGFTGLSFAADGVVMAAGTTYGSQWRIDLRSATAERIASQIPGGPTCAIS